MVLRMGYIYIYILRRQAADEGNSREKPVGPLEDHMKKRY